MALPTKKGLRKITVRGILYYWKLVTQQEFIVIKIGGVSKPSDFIIVNASYKDMWLGFGENEPVLIVTPLLIRKAIDFVATGNKDKYFLYYENNSFREINN